MTGAQYDRVAVVLHWAMAALIGVNLGLGFWMHEAIDLEQTRASAAQVYQWHKSVGLLLLLLAVFRLAWRLASPDVYVPGPSWQRLLAGCTHGLLYGLMFALPLSGWLMVSVQWRGDGPLQVPTHWFGLFEVPHLLNLTAAPEALRAQIWKWSVTAHEIGVWLMLGLLLGHVSAALLHATRSQEGSPASAENAALGFRMRWKAAARSRVSGLRLLGWLTVFVVAFAAAALLPRNSTTEEGLVSAFEWAPAAEVGLPVWVADRGHSSIRFAGAVNGEAFHGHFEQWDVRIRLDPRQPESAQLQARILTGSATNGVPLHERTLKEPEWFNVQRYPFASFEMTALTPVDGLTDSYQLRGQLKIKDQLAPVSSLILKVDDAKMRISGQVQLDRSALNLGMVSDPDAETVSRYINVDVQVLAHRAPEA